MFHQIGPGVGGQRLIETATRMPDQHVARLHRRDDGIAPIGQGGVLSHERAVAG